MSVQKAELHVHLEGTISPTLAQRLAKRNGLHLNPNLISPDGNSYQFKDFPDFLNAYDAVAALIKNPVDYYELTFDYLRSIALRGAIYSEMMYSPDHAEQASGIPSSEHLAAIQQAIDDAKLRYQIIGRIIITAVRHFGADSAIQVATQALKEKQPCIVGFGLGGDEINFPPHLFKRAYQIAAEGGLQCTVHAGEFGTAEGMLEAMRELPIKRIGHGVKAIGSIETIAQLKDKNIALEICPSSNIALGLFADMNEHPLPQFKEHGLMLSLGSDDPPFFNCNLPGEYERVQKAYGYSDKTMTEFTQMAIESSFADEDTKSALRARINQA